ncbi:hypothetical protein RHMOL_Rhmol08G0230300 [Rhododendron molle]|uniref:Uncharacterized protein n=1 Tax=Rhododendron molle TaxID=49168 RepID=A0ACC0MSQ4_RHOML|nr:hypothetical protein RHMOL_Rhmol08G0230300 [Rhododendron molle]
MRLYLPLIYTESLPVALYSKTKGGDVVINELQEGHLPNAKTSRGISAGSNAYNLVVIIHTHCYVGLAPPPSEPYGGSHVPPVPVPLPLPVPAPCSYLSVRVVSCSKRTQTIVIETPNK